MKRYTDDERPNACCYDCGLEYGGNAWMDALVPNDVWAIINPTFHEGAGILCVSCINRRCVEAGLSNVPVWIASGALTSKDYDTLTPAVLKANSMTTSVTDEQV